MSMRLFPNVELGEPIAISVIDPSKRYKEPGQLIKYSGTLQEMERIAFEARGMLREIRWYYKNLGTNDDDELIASQVIVTEIPPGHVQPFHTHHTIHEVTLVLEGSVTAVDSDMLTEDELRGNWSIGKVVHKMQMVIEGPGTRHTICNHGHEYAKFVTIQTARIPIDEFPKDWHRDAPKGNSN